MGRDTTGFITANRFTLIHDRFQIGCSVCGFLAGYSKFRDSLLYAQNKKSERHNQPNEIITIFDLMARKGNANLWGVDGKMIARKES